jgi:hypothetical protein
MRVTSHRALILTQARSPGQREQATTERQIADIDEKAGWKVCEQRRSQRTTKAFSVPETHLLNMPPRFWAAFFFALFFIFFIMISAQQS